MFVPSLFMTAHAAAPRFATIWTSKGTMYPSA